MPTHGEKEDKLVYSFQELWTHSGLGRDYLREAIRSGRLRSIKVGRVYKVPKSELEAFILREASLK